MTKQDQLQSVLDDVTAEVTDIHAAVLASHDGLAMASTIGGAEGSRVAAMAATVHAVGNRATSTADLGTIEETVIRGRQVTFVVYNAGESAVLALMAPGDCNLGMVHLEGRRAAENIATLLTRPVPPVPVAGETARPPQAPPPPPAPVVADDADVESAAVRPNGTPPRGTHERDGEPAPV